MASLKVIGGAGFIGRQVVAALLNAGQTVEAPSQDEFDIAAGDPQAMAHLCTLSPDDWSDQNQALGIDRDLLFRSVVDPQRRTSWLEKVVYALFVGE